MACAGMLLITLKILIMTPRCHIVFLVGINNKPMQCMCMFTYERLRTRIGKCSVTLYSTIIDYHLVYYLDYRLINSNGKHA